MARWALEEWPVKEPEFEGSDTDSLAGAKPVRLEGPVIDLGQANESVRPVKRSDGPVMFPTWQVIELSRPVEGSVGPESDIAGPVKDSDGPVNELEVPVRDTGGPGIGSETETGRSEESSLSPKTSAVVRERLVLPDRIVFESVRTGLGDKAGRAPVPWSKSDLSEVDFGRLRSGLPDCAIFRLAVL